MNELITDFGFEPTDACAKKLFSLFWSTLEDSFSRSAKKSVKDENFLTSFEDEYPSVEYWDPNTAKPGEIEFVKCTFLKAYCELRHNFFLVKELDALDDSDPAKAEFKKIARKSLFRSNLKASRSAQYLAPFFKKLLVSDKMS